LQFAKPLFDQSGYGGLRRVIGCSADGSNNMGRRSPSCAMRCCGGHHHQRAADHADPGYGTGPSIPNLDVYYETA